MKETGIFYGSSTGCCYAIAEMIRSDMDIHQGDMYDVAHAAGKDVCLYRNLILGLSTWENGNIQEDWSNFIKDIGNLDLSDKKIALYGLGDQENYSDNFADALGTLHKKLIPTGCTFCGLWPADDYSFRQSNAYCNGKFVGLVIDEDTQSLFTTLRVKQWSEQVRYEFSLPKEMIHSPLSMQFK